MADKEYEIKKKFIMRLYKSMRIGGTFSVSFTFIDYLFFRHIWILYGFFISLAMYISAFVVHYFTFKNPKIQLKQSVILHYLILLIGLSALTYLAGGYAGAMISAFYGLLLVSSFMFDKKKTKYSSILVIVVYLSFFVAEEFFNITPVVTEVKIIKYSKAIIDILMFIVIMGLSSMISENAEYTIKFYKLRGERLKKMKKRLEILVRRRTRELEDANKKLRELDRKKDEFISIASHELQTPMASIHGFSGLLRDKKIFKDREKRDRYLKIMEDESMRMSKMVKDMLNLSRIDMGTMKFDVDTVDVNGFLEEIGLEMEGIAGKKGLKLTVHSTKGLPKMRTDKEKLRQILINIINNSIKYTEKGSITVTGIKKGKSIQFSVADTGIGIPKDKHEKIFERFYQVESPATRKVLGAGLGLSIVREYVRLMGGRIWLESNIGKGSTFYFTLPIKFRKPRKTKQPKRK